MRKSKIADESTHKKEKRKRAGFFKLATLLSPFLILGFIPVIGLIVSIIGFTVFGLASLAHYVVSQKNSKEKEPLISEKKASDEARGKVSTKDCVKTYAKESVLKEGRENGDGMQEEKGVHYADRKTQERQSGRRNTEAGKDKPFSVRPCLQGGVWLKEDRKRRKLGSENEELTLYDPASEALSESSGNEDFYDRSEYDLSGYESFSEIDDSSNSEEEAESGGHIRTRRLRMGGGM